MLHLGNIWDISHVLIFCFINFGTMMKNPLQNLRCLQIFARQIRANYTNGNGRVSNGLNKSDIFVIDCVMRRLPVYAPKKYV